MRKFLKQLFCWHRFDYEDPTLMAVGHRAGDYYAKCEKCGKRIWL